MILRRNNMIHDRRNPAFPILLFVVGLVLISFSCDYFTEPTPEVNKVEQPFKVDSTTKVISNYSPNQTVSGNINALYGCTANS